MKYNFEIIAGVIFGLFFTWALIGFINSIYAASRCLEYGYKEAKVDLVFNKYCIKRVDQTDIIIPLNKIKDEK